MVYMSESVDRAFRSAFADYLVSAQDFFIEGGVVTATPSGTSTVYSITAGHAFYKGELIYMDAHSITKLSSQVVYLELYEDAVDIAPVLNIDGNTDQVMIRRRIRLRVGSVYPVTYMSIDAPRKEAIDRLRLKGRIVLPGMIMPYYGTLSDFDGTGLGIANQPMEGWAICNGINGTPDMRGMVAAGATNVPDSGAPSINPAVGWNTDVGSVSGNDKHQIDANELPPHTHDYDDSFVGGSGTHVAYDNGMAHIHLAKTTESNTTNHNHMDMRQATFSVVWIMSITP
jgi:hypothetical protein